MVPLAARPGAERAVCHQTAGAGAARHAQRRIGSRQGCASRAGRAVALVSTGAGRDRPIRIVIADDHGVFREALGTLLEAEPDFRVVGIVGDGRDAVALVRELCPDILLLDVAMPHVGGIETLRQITAGASPTRVILLTGAIDKADIVTAIQLGARGLVLKESGAAVLLKGIRGVMAGQYWIGREAVSDLIEVLRSLGPSGGGAPRE